MSNAVIKLVINMVTSFLHIRSITKWLNIYRLNNPLIAKMKVNKKSRNNHNIPAAVVAQLIYARILVIHECVAAVRRLKLAAIGSIQAVGIIHNIFFMSQFYHFQ